MRPGYIPIEPWLSVVKREIGYEENANKKTGRGICVYLGRRCNLKNDSIEKSLKRHSIDFDLADLIMCRIGAQGLWYEEPLKDIYYSVDLSDAA